MAQIPNIETWFERAYPQIDYRQEIIAQWQKTVDEARAQGEDVAHMPALIMCADGVQRWFSVSAQIEPSCRDDLHIITFRNIHDYKISLAEAERQSQIDPLTQLKNRRGFFTWSEPIAPETLLGLIILISTILSKSTIPTVILLETMCCAKSPDCWSKTYLHCLAVCVGAVKSFWSALNATTWRM